MATLQKNPYFDYKDQCLISLLTQSLWRFLIYLGLIAITVIILASLGISIYQQVTGTSAQTTSRYQQPQDQLMLSGL